MTTREISENFSTGKFESVFGHIAENAVWTVVGENKFEGKKAIEANCRQVAAYFQSVETKFTTQHVIAEEGKVMVSGTAEFIRDGKTVSFISACDLYEFNPEGQIEKITSYCIQHNGK
jgi:ketosteroid isomerase-like protein